MYPPPFSDDRRVLTERIQQLQPEGGTLLYDATYSGIETLVAARREGKNAVVVLTDGKDESPGSRYSDQLVIDRAKEEKVPLYMLGLGQPDEINETVMKRMADETGGKYFHAGSEQRLFEIFEKLSIDLHDDGINEQELRTLAEKTGGKFFWARDASKLAQVLRGVGGRAAIDVHGDVPEPALQPRRHGARHRHQRRARRRPHEQRRLRRLQCAWRRRTGDGLSHLSRAAGLAERLPARPGRRAPALPFLRREVMHTRDTITALSTAPGPGGRAIVRISGPASIAVVAALFAAPQPLVAGRRCSLSGHLRLPDLAPLPADMYFWAEPHSYTGQDLAEIHTLSCPPLLELLIAQLLQAGCRAALPGEFTLRAFLAGKLDLTRAEAVHAVIESSSRDDLKQALKQLAGGMARPLHELREDLLNLLADVEAGLDFADEDITFVRPEETLKRLAKALAQVTLLGKQVDQRGVADRVFRVVLTGRPNAGKSSLFNALAGADALVSPEPGTTRDYLMKRLNLGGMRVELIDTPGWQTEIGTIENQAQALAREQAEKADLLLLCLEAGQAVAPKRRRFAVRSIRQSSPSPPNAIVRQPRPRCCPPVRSREPALERCERCWPSAPAARSSRRWRRA